MKIERRHRRKVNMFNAAKVLDDLKVSPDIRLLKVSHYRPGPYSLRINDQYCIFFCFDDGVVTEVEIVDYHQEAHMAKLIPLEHPGVI